MLEVPIFNAVALVLTFAPTFTCVDTFAVPVIVNPLVPVIRPEAVTAFAVVRPEALIVLAFKTQR